MTFADYLASRDIAEFVAELRHAERADVWHLLYGMPRAAPRKAVEGDDGAGGMRTRESVDDALNWGV